MTVESQTRIAHEHVERLTANAPLLTAEYIPGFSDLVNQGKLEPDTPVTNRQIFISPLAGGIVRSVIVNRYTAEGRQALYEANNFGFNPHGSLIVLIDKRPFDAAWEPIAPWVRSAFQFGL